MTIRKPPLLPRSRSRPIGLAHAEGLKPVRGKVFCRVSPRRCSNQEA
jgi:hypothetical protein